MTIYTLVRFLFIYHIIKSFLVYIYYNKNGYTIETVEHGVNGAK